MARGKAHETDEKTEQLVKQMAAVGITHEQIAKVIKISVDTLTRKYKDILETARTEANTAVGGALFKNCMAGNVAAQIFWMKTRAGWRETEPEDGNKTQISKINLIISQKPEPK